MCEICSKKTDEDEWLTKDDYELKARGRGLIHTKIHAVHQRRFHRILNGHSLITSQKESLNVEKASMGYISRVKIMNGIEERISKVNEGLKE